MSSLRLSHGLVALLGALPAGEEDLRTPRTRRRREDTTSHRFRSAPPGYVQLGLLARRQIGGPPQTEHCRLR
ncbi:hypothetical protein BGZ61DRAFT_464519 [Ilyonectria robusta]|uniref:uncharacterized protein n=1 Tax=Ilyonectria robusta TaxID=1079257 RepID=UPI001E8E198E|nr:uncharacterized protein BGZ61DRAFT_464519 [Ilyonectria robusta]KAH8661021.1 hypothetical protein BGZ61DRAFT_464519 [Ilyonectria robusta]